MSLIWVTALTAILWMPYMCWADPAEMAMATGSIVEHLHCWEMPNPSTRLTARRIHVGLTTPPHPLRFTLYVRSPEFSTGKLARAEHDPGEQEHRFRTAKRLS